MLIGTPLVGPLRQVFFLFSLGRELGVVDDRFHFVGDAVPATSASCVYGGTTAIAAERRFGTLGAVLLPPRRRVPLGAGRALPYVLNGVFAFRPHRRRAGVRPGRVRGRSLPGLALGLLAATGACPAFGLALAALGLRFRDVFLVSNVASPVLLLMTGPVVPRETLPEWMRTAGEPLPLTHAPEAAPGLTGRGLDGALLGAELPVGAGHGAHAVALLALFERGGRRRAAPLDVMRHMRCGGCDGCDPGGWQVSTGHLREPGREPPRRSPGIRAHDAGRCQPLREGRPAHDG
ncbi:ABC transporter permease [Streptomyces lateritius]|nr:ABC transporter permease [Streptomyces lateritius]